MSEWNSGNPPGKRPPYNNANGQYYRPNPQSDWNYDQAAWYNGQDLNVPYNNPQQYVGFNEFLNQYRPPQPSNQNYSHNQLPNLSYATPMTAQPLVNQNNAYYNGASSSSYDAVPYYAYNGDKPDLPNSDNNGMKYPTPASESSKGSQKTNQSKSKNNQSTSSQNVETSNLAMNNTKLTPFAKEFVPQNSVVPSSNNDPGASPKNVKKNSHPKNDKWKPKGKASDNWRLRDDDSDDESDVRTFTVYNSTRQSDNYADDAGGSTQSSDRNDRNNGSKSNYAKNKTTGNKDKNKSNNFGNNVKKDSNHFDRNYNNRNFNNDKYSEEDSSSSRYRYNKSSYSNETFRQKDWQKNQNPERSNSFSNTYEDTSKNQGPSARKSNYTKKEALKGKKESEVSQREKLTDQLNRGTLECLVCCERVRQNDSVWSCSNCFHVFHLKCIIKWATSSITESQWRCPACQNKATDVPKEYRCFCGKQQNPEWCRGADTAHTCGDTCGKTVICDRHPCTLLCHPGPCPQCDATIQKYCECGATSQWIRCSNTQPLLCANPCNKTLNCKTHICEEKCHADNCQPCQKTVEQICNCVKKEKRIMSCTLDTIGIIDFSCNGVCDKLLNCGNHKCKKICHNGPCDECSLIPEKIKMCPCGQTQLTEKQKRTSCLDEIPKCGKICSKVLKCGPSDEKHSCPKKCHDGECPPCEKKTSVPCRCGNINKNISCVDLEKERFNVKCEKRCSKKQSCGKHRCKTLCCIDIEHRCTLPCTRTLSCGLHKCDATCHSGRCDTCWRTSFDELRCRCGASVRYPPVECGTRPPACSKPCSEVRPCGHQPLHNCHPVPSTCPPCAVLTQKYCYGRHEMRKTIPCHQKEFSCGMPCGKELSCGKHKCIEVCHKGDCPTSCKQPCEVIRGSCGHRCAALCGHESTCPSSSACKVMVQSSCACARRKLQRICSENMKDLSRIQAGGMTLMGPSGQPVDIIALISRGNNTTTLECDDECQVEDRNRRLAIGLQIRNPDVSAKLIPRYSESLKQFAAKDENFCNKVHEALSQLVVLAQKSKQKTRSHSFQPMNWQKRQFIHEMCQHFGCDSVSYDSEPYRNIVATAYREKSWLPAASLMEVIRRDKGQRRVPGPIMSSASSSSSQLMTVPSARPTTSILKPSNSGSAWATVGSSKKKTENSRPKIDYFDNPPE